MEDSKKFYNHKGVKFKECYYENDKLYRIVWYYTYADGNIEEDSYYQDDELHKEDGPAMIKYYSNGQVGIEKYFINGKLHRLDGPASILYYSNGNIESEYYCNNNLKHRIDGPAVINYGLDGNITYEEYWVNDKEYDDIFQYSVVVGSL
jgi:antitoxin component YwqK of YwqJK toxin-antitoxin module